jgi:GCN5-related N-acetyl-transferase
MVCQREAPAERPGLRGEASAARVSKPAFLHGSWGRRCCRSWRVSETAEGTGVGSLLVEQALEDTRKRGLNVVALCPFVASYIRRYPDYADLVEADPSTPT